MPSSYRPRLSIELTNEQARKLQRLIPWGLKNQLFQALVDDVIELVEEHGEIVIAAIISRQLKARSMKSLKDVVK